MLKKNFTYKILAVFFLISSASASQNVILNHWLRTSQLTLSAPAFDKNRGKKGIADFLNLQHIQFKKLEPKANKKFNWPNKATKWTKTDTSEKVVSFNFTKNTRKLEYLATYLKTERWLQGELKISSSLPLKIWLDDKLILTKCSPGKPSEESTSKSVPVNLTTGTHKLILKVLKPENYPTNSALQAELQIDKNHQKFLQNIITPEYTMDLDKVINVPRISDVVLSANGNYFTVIKSQLDSSDKQKWIEIRNYANGSLNRTIKRSNKITDFKWAPQGHTYSYLTHSKGKTTLWINDMDQGTSEKLIQDQKNFKSYTWVKDSKSIIYTLSNKTQNKEKKVTRLEHLSDRMPSNRSKDFLYQVYIQSGNKKRLTKGDLSTNLMAVSPRGNKAIISRKYTTDYSKRPFYYKTYYLLNLETMKTDSLFESKWLNTIDWAPGGNKLLITGGASTFDRQGVNLPQNRTPNEYDIQAYLYNLQNQKITPISKSFSPSIISGEWISKNKIFFRANDRSKIKLFQYNPQKNNYREIDSKIETIDGFDFADNNSQRALYFGSSAASPTRINKLTFGWGNKNELLAQPLQKYYQNTKLGRVKKWTFNNKDGIEIEGRVHYPPNFDKSQKYPCIVYYYGGTIPTTRDFRGTYPKNYWAANGYVVYVLQPSGAIGFGQQFSSHHINEWGTKVPQEITTGVKKLIQNHSFIKKDAIGCIGASYGGFTTEKLITETEMFSAAVSHAGISSIAGYWGTGYWGYEYSSIVSPNKYPWSDTDYFIKNSPYFQADSINTPLLLTHGRNDHNVPPGQSIQLYTALSILNKNVELIRIKGQGHHITEPKRRRMWTKSILAWFDKQLKGQDAWWNHIYKD